MFAPTPLLRARPGARAVTRFGPAIVALLLLSAPAHAQSASAVEGASGGVTVGGELDNYLRYLESLGRTPLLPWGLRPFSPSVVDSLSDVRGAHPWATQWMFSKPTHPVHARILPIEVTERYNSSYPYGINEGPVWAGRGLTSAVSAGFAIAAGPFTATVKPVVFRAENQSFALRPNGYTGKAAFRDAREANYVDRPQRFGNGPYVHVDPGETTLRVDALGVSLGATSANEWWGPMSEFPYVVGNNAAGVPRVFLGTRGPVNILIGKLQVRVEYGVEFQSDFSPVVGPDTFVSSDSSGRRRLMSGLAATFSPAIFPGLEIDAGRYFHEAWTGHFGIDQLKSPFEGLAKSKIPRGTVLPTDNRDALKNQLASISFRWVLPHSGLDVFGEYGREDFAENNRALEVEPDLSRIASLGFRKAFRRRDSTAFDALRAEVLDANPTTIGTGRSEGHIYEHAPLRQGHTEEGKLIGTGAGIDAPAAATVAWEQYRRAGRTSIYLLKMTEDGASDTPSTPVTTAAAGVSGLRFTRLGVINFDLAAVHTTRLFPGWAGWNLAATLGLVWHFD